MKTRRGMAMEKQHFQMEIRMRDNTRMGRDMVMEHIDSKTWLNMLESTQMARSMDKVNCLIVARGVALSVTPHVKWPSFFR